MAMNPPSWLLWAVILLGTLVDVVSFLPLRSCQPLVPVAAPIVSKRRKDVSALKATILNDTFSGPLHNQENEGDLAILTSDIDDRHPFMQPLLQWAVDSGVEFSSGTEIVADFDGDWGVELVEPLERGTPVLVIPKDLVLSTEDFEGTELPGWMRKRMSSSFYLPECLLVFRLLEELSKGRWSPWYTWLQSLPAEFSTGLYLDPIERTHVVRMAPKFIEQHEKQWLACNSLIMDAVRNANSIHSPEFAKWLVSQPNLLQTIKWAFSIVLTRSWRTPDGAQATLVPMGDMINHDSRLANVRPSFRASDNALQLCTTRDIDCSCEKPTGVYLSYGLSHHPARFLVNFGFCDTSAPLVDAHLDRYLQRNRLPPISDQRTWPPFDPSQLVVSADNGVIAEDVWVVFLIKVLRQREPFQIQRIQRAYDTDDEKVLNELVEELFQVWEFPVAIEMKQHIEDVLRNVYPPLSFSQRELSEHPHLAMIEKYNVFMRTAFLRTHEYLCLVAGQTSKLLTGIKK